MYDGLDFRIARRVHAFRPGAKMSVCGWLFASGSNTQKPRRFLTVHAVRSRVPSLEYRMGHVFAAGVCTVVFRGSLSAYA